MRAVVLRKLGAPLTIEQLELPPLARGQVLVRMQLAAVCHSQKLEVSGGRGEDRFLPHLIGHEGVGLVEEVGPGVTKVHPGDQVVLSWIRGTGESAEPIRYGSRQGTVNAGPIATFCESPVVSEQCITRIHPPADPEVAVLAGCAIPTGAGTVWNAMPASRRGSICIIGAGGVGLAAVSGAVYAGWATVAVADLRPQRLERAAALGATHTVDAGKEELEQASMRITGGQGFDLVVECAGTSRSMEAAVRIAKPRGGRTVIVGNLKAGQAIAVDPFDLIAGRSLTGSWGGGINPDVDIPRCVRLVERGALNHRLLMGRRFSLEQINDAILSLDGDDPGRPILECQPSASSAPAEACAQTMEKVR